MAPRAAEAADAIQYLPGCETNVLEAGDDNASGTGGVNVYDPGAPPAVAQPIGFTLNFFGAGESQLYVNNNGNISFGSAQGAYTPDGLSSPGHPAIIAPFWADVDTRSQTLAATPSPTSTTPPPDENVTYGPTTFDGHLAYCVLWHNVGYFNQETDKLNDFQLLIVDRPDQGTSANGDDFDFFFNYNQVQWETGDYSGGTDGLGGSCAEIGYTNGSGDSGTWAQDPNPEACSVLLDSDPAGLTSTSLNTSILGSRLFQARSGTVVALPTL
ncbi:MAG: hypothetical protein JOY80_11560, partial [Candidatus Dormibacteraeota bacterium]|nr:hypothetical protein [Candidatus Dormibacteraeota bacterium]